MDIMSKFNLPKYLKGKTFAEASKAIDDKFKDRTDAESLATMNEMQSRLKQAQEFVKAKQEELSKPKEDINSTGDNKMFLGGAMSGEGGLFGSSATEGFLGGAGGAGNAAGGVGAGAIMGAATGALDLAGMIGNNKIDTSGRTNAEYTDRVGNAGKGALSGAKVGGAIAPGIGHAIGAVGGGLIGAFSGPSDKDVTKAKANNLYASMKDTGMEGSNIARFGLDLKNYLDQLPQKTEAMDLSGLGSGIADFYDPINDSPRQARRAMDLSGLGKGISSFDANQNALSQSQELGEGSFKEYNNPSFADKARFGASKILSPENLKYAPAAMNISQLSNLEQPKDIAFGRSNRKYQQQLVDEQGLQNTVRQATASNRDAILSSAGGSSAKARAALLGSQLQGTKALSQAYQQAGVENRGEARNAQAFDQATERFNIGQADKAQLTNLQRDAAYQTNRSKLLSQIGQDLGGIGREELFKKYPELAGLGYDSKGRKIKK